MRRGLYRLRHFRISSPEHVVAAWLPLRDAGAVVSHESALELHDLSDLIPVAVHLSLPRAKRGSALARGAVAHAGAATGGLGAAHRARGTHHLTGAQHCGRAGRGHSA